MHKHMPHVIVNHIFKFSPTTILHFNKTFNLKCFFVQKPLFLKVFCIIWDADIYIKATISANTSLGTHKYTKVKGQTLYSKKLIKKSIVWK